MTTEVQTEVPAKGKAATRRAARQTAVKNAEAKVAAAKETPAKSNGSNGKAAPKTPAMREFKVTRRFVAEYEQFFTASGREEAQAMAVKAGANKGTLSEIHSQYHVRLVKSA